MLLSPPTCKHMHAGISSVLAQLTTKLDLLTTKHDLLTTKHELLQQEVLPWLQSEHGVHCSSVFGQLPAGVTTTIHGALPCLMHSAELEISESSHASSSSQSGKNVGIMHFLLNVCYSREAKSP